MNLNVPKLSHAERTDVASHNIAIHLFLYYFYFTLKSTYNKIHAIRVVAYLHELHYNNLSIFITAMMPGIIDAAADG